MLEKDIAKLGLSDKEAKVYLASLELGPSTVQVISQRADVNRATTYVVIDSLMDMGLMSTYDEGKKTLFVAESPERLLDYLKSQGDTIQKKIDLLQRRMPELSLLVNTKADRPTVKYFEGYEGLRTIQADFVSSLNSSETICVFLPFDDYIKTGLKEKVPGLVEERNRKKIKMEIIYTSEKGRQTDYEKTESINYKEYLYVDYDKYPFHGGINIWGTKVLMIDYKGKAGGIVIENKTLADTMRSIFYLIWNSKKTIK